MATLLYNPRPSVQPSRALSALLADMLHNPQPASARPATTFTPAADVLETATGFELHLALPGVRKDALSIEFLDGELVVAGERPHPAAAAKEAGASATEANPAADHTPTVVSPEAPAAPRFHRTETNFGPFSRRFRLPETVNVKAIGAELADGVLRVTLPFDTEKVTKQRIEIRG